MDCSSSRNRLQNWRSAKIANRSANTIQIAFQPNLRLEGSRTNQKKRTSLAASNFLWALLITIIIILAQLFIVHHYFGHPARMRTIFSSIASREANLLKKFDWFCYSFNHLNYVTKLASDLQIDLVIIDPDLLSLLLADRNEIEALGDKEEVKFSAYGAKSSQEANEKTIIHLAAINETSGGQPNLRSFLNRLKRRYHLIEYHDVSETMPAELYKRPPNQLDDAQADHDEEMADSAERSRLLSLEAGEISKVYTEFATHVFIVNTSHNTGGHLGLRDEAPPTNECSSSTHHGGRQRPFVVLHLFVIYNYEFQPEGYWMQSSLLLNELDRHKLLTYGVHAIDFRVPLDHYYIHRKRKISTLLEAGSSLIPIKQDKPLAQLKVLDEDHIFHYVNNSYLNCKQSSFNISALSNENRKISSYLIALDSSKAPRISTQSNSIMLEQLSMALQFMNVFSRSYGNFNFWLTGSSLLAYYKFCQLVALTQKQNASGGTPGQEKPATGGGDDDDNDLAFWLGLDTDEEFTVNDDTIVELELGLFESELSSSTMRDLSEAGMIGVTLLTDWRDPERNGLVSFRIKDCPNIMFNLHFYKLVQDSFGQHYVTNNNMLYNYKFRRRKSRAPNPNESSGPTRIMHHVFSLKNLELCWTRLDRLEPFRVPCDIHEHLFKIYIQS